MIVDKPLLSIITVVYNGEDSRVRDLLLT